jgi:hypothetical protein
MNTTPPFESFNETDVREEIIAPLLRRLGYRSGTKYNIIREQSLRYPQLSLGRKIPKKDPPLRGKADYILEVEDRLRWTIEAKAPEVPIQDDDIQQAWTYANHPEVRGIYFVLCNGRTWVVYRTAHGPNAPAVLSLEYEGLEADFQLLANVLGPPALVRDFPSVEIDTGLPIAPGLRSVARITNGFIRYTQSNLDLQVLTEFQNNISQGAIERDERGQMIAFVQATGPVRSLQELNERLGLSRFEMTSEASQLSIDPAVPTRFSYNNRIILPKGERVLNILDWQYLSLPFNITCDIGVDANGYFANHLFSGSFDTKMRYTELPLNVELSGTFEIYLA